MKFHWTPEQTDQCDPVFLLHLMAREAAEARILEARTGRPGRDEVRREHETVNQTLERLRRRADRRLTVLAS